MTSSAATLGGGLDGSGWVTRSSGGGSSRLAFQRRRITTARRKSVELGALQEFLLSRGEVRLRTAPALQCMILQSAPVAEGELPREGSQSVHERQMQSRLLG